jgi:hypothetical protein
LEEIKRSISISVHYGWKRSIKNVYKNQISRQTGSRNLTGPKTLPTIWHTYMKLVTKCQISAVNSYWEKCDEKYLGRTEVKLRFEAKIFCHIRTRSMFTVNIYFFMRISRVLCFFKHFLWFKLYKSDQFQFIISD